MQRDNDLEIEEGSGNIFADLGLPDAEELQFKSELALAIRRIIKSEGLTQVAAAVKMGVSQPDVSHIMNAKISKFSTDRLLVMLAHLGRNLTLSIEKSERAIGEMHLIGA